MKALSWSAPLFLGCLLVGIVAIDGLGEAKDPLLLRFDILSARGVEGPAALATNVVTDLDGDNVDELVFFRNDHIVQAARLVDRDWRVRWEHFVPPPWRYSRSSGLGVFKVAGSSSPPIVAVSVSHGDTLAVALLGRPGGLQLFDPIVVRDSNDDGEVDSWLNPLCLLQHPDLEEPALIAALRSGRDHNPRAVLAYSLTTGRELWRYETGPNPELWSFQSLDLDGGPGEEILFTTSSPYNGRCTETSADSLAYMMALSATGERLWQRTIAGAFRAPVWGEVFRPPSAGPYVVSCAKNNSSKIEGAQAEPPVDTLRVWTGDTGVLLEVVEWPDPIRWFCRIDSTRFVISTSNGLISSHEVSPEGRVIELASQTSIPPIRIDCVGDVDGDGRMEFLGTRWDWSLELVVLDEDLEVIGASDLHTDLNDGTIDLMRRSDGPPLILVHYGARRVVLEAHRITDPRPTARSTAGLIFVGVLGSAIGLFILWRRSRQAGQEPSEPTGSGTAKESRIGSGIGNLKRLREELLEATEVADHGFLAVTKIAHRVCFLLKGVVGPAEPGAESIVHTQAVAKDFVRITVPQIDHILSLARALGHDAADLDEIAGSFETLKISIKPVADKDWMPDDATVDLARTRTAIDRLENGLQRVSWAVRAAVATPLHAEIESARAAADSVASGIGAVVKVEIGLPPGSLVRSHPGDLAIVLEDLLANALRAVEGRDRREVHLTARVDGEQAIIEVQDTGCGIPEEDWERIFMARVSGRPTGGTGLYASQNIIGGVGGVLRVQDSVMDKGTTMELRVVCESGDDTEAQSAESIERVRMGHETASSG